MYRRDATGSSRPPADIDFDKHAEAGTVTVVAVAGPFLWKDEDA